MPIVESVEVHDSTRSHLRAAASCDPPSQHEWLLVLSFTTRFQCSRDGFPDCAQAHLLSVLKTSLYSRHDSTYSSCITSSPAPPAAIRVSQSSSAYLVYLAEDGFHLLRRPDSCARVPASSTGTRRQASRRDRALVANACRTRECNPQCYVTSCYAGTVRALLPAAPRCTPRCRYAHFTPARLSTGLDQDDACSFDPRWCATRTSYIAGMPCSLA